MEWMLDIQLGRRNISTGELIYANSIVADEIALENKERISKAVSESNRNRTLKSNSVQMDGNEIKDKKSHISPTHTREQVAKMSGVGAGTVARFNKVMNSDDEEKTIINREV